MASTLKVPILSSAIVNASLAALGKLAGLPTLIVYVPLEHNGAGEVLSHTV